MPHGQLKGYLAGGACDCRGEDRQVLRLNEILKGTAEQTRDGDAQNLGRSGIAHPDQPPVIQDDDAFAGLLDQRPVIGHTAPHRIRQQSQ